MRASSPTCPTRWPARSTWPTGRPEAPARRNAAAAVRRARRHDARPVPAASACEEGIRWRFERADRAVSGARRRGAGGHQPDRLRVLLPDRLGLLQLRAPAAASPSARAGAAPPAAWSPTAWASPTSTRSQHGLIFERFLNIDRVSMPDIDCDFSVEGREQGDPLRHREVRRPTAWRRSSPSRRMASKAAIRDVGRVLERAARATPTGWPSWSPSGRAVRRRSTTR